ncbi:MAG: hypothetical protein ACW97A_01010 [Candidatus Thorarchaeota archaeon]|jgi:hypothetical protein
MEIDSGDDRESLGPDTRDFSVSSSELVTRTLSLFKRKFVSYILIVGVAQFLYAFSINYIVFSFFGLTSPGIFSSDPFSIISGLAGLVGSASVFIIAMVILSMVGTILLTVVAGGAVKLALDNYGSPSEGEASPSLSFALSRAVKLIATQLIISSILFLIMSPVVLVLLTGITAFDPYDVYAYMTVMMTIGPVLAICGVVMLYMSVRLAPIIAVVIAEDKSIIDSIKRTWMLTGGNFWHIFFGQMMLAFVIGLIVGAIGVFNIPLLFSGGFWILILSSSISLLFFSPVMYIFQAVLYKDLMSRSGMQSTDWW